MWNVDIAKTGSEVWVYNVDSITHKPEFIARFKHANPGRSAKHFVKFLVAHFTPTEYFAMYNSRLAPLDILRTKGFVSYNVLRANKS